MSTITIAVKGMTCGGCVKSVTNALNRVQGVREAKVDLASAKATVTFDETKTTVESLKEAIEEAGYDTE
ncbi:copper ion binding protein [Sulfoacidibacillus thermotolerans]|uniref:Copper chaperone CopZ n=1 Tax=Sulfoacidibacillus thermotolerans TaxID=1765684 RepID=A0A2U3D8E5_SULT2|nr:copper ion binding protein [Sulfoacidibacillus thermotolerans]PWI57541.1 hypothetical protein BM613_07905 [Sulfoacidibacillus thermotolerans]